MKAINDKNIEYIINEYVKYGLLLNIFTNDKVMEIKNKLLDLDIIYDNNISGDAYVRGNTLTINKIRTFKSQKNAELVLFHEFDHKCNSIHNDIYSPKSLSKKYNDYCINRYNIQINDNDVSNPYQYCLYGFLMIDEVISEYIATLMVNMKYNLNSKKIYTKNYGDKLIKYESDFEYYGIGQSLVDLFSKTLFIPQREKNLLGISKRCFDDNYIKELIYQHFENNNSIKGLFQELCYMGVVCFDYERWQGHLPDKKDIPSAFVYNSYFLAKECLISGSENREKIPNNIQKPSFL